MVIDFLDYKQKFDNDGYFILKNFVKKDSISQILEEIDNSQNTIKYFDNLNNLRRIEKLYDKGQYLINLNEKISVLLKDVFDKEFLIFKDKFNAKPPGGEGFFAHYDGVFKFTARNVPKNTPTRIKIPKDFTILKSTASYSMCVLVEIIDVGIIIAKEVPTERCILVTRSKSKTVNA